MASGENDIAERLRDAIARRDLLRPGTPAHWRAACEARALMKRMVAATGRPDVAATTHVSGQTRE